MQIRRGVFNASQWKGLDGTICACHSAIDQARLVETLRLQVMHEVIGVIGRGMTPGTSGFSKENSLSPHLRLGCLLRIKPSVDPELGSRREIQQCLELRHEMDLAPPFKDVDPFFRSNHRVAVKISSPLFKFGEIFDRFQCPLGPK